MLNLIMNSETNLNYEKKLQYLNEKKYVEIYFMHYK